MNDMEEDKNYINLIRGDLTKASQAQNGMPDSVGHDEYQDGKPNHS